MIRRLSIATFFALTLVAGAAQAGSVGISPTNLVTTPNQKAQALTLTNPGDTTLRYQPRLMKWTLVDGRDVLTPTSELLAAPAIVEIPPRSRRVVRVVRVAGTGTGYYRLILEQLPEPREANQTGLQLLVNQDLPVAFEPATTALPPLSAARVAGGVALTNTGTVAARITAIGPVGATPWKQGVVGWVLPGTTRVVPLEQSAPELSLVVNRKPVTVSVQ